jgi:hypothetical protein
MANLSETIDTYLAGWNETDRERRLAVLERVWSTGGRLIVVERVWATGGRLTDPPLDATGRDEISEMVATLQSQFPGHRFVRVSTIDEHGNHFRFTWDLVAADGSVILNGLDVGELADDGTISRVTGFLGALASYDAA